MEPGHEDREYRPPKMRMPRSPLRPSMEPGHEDREYLRRRPGLRDRCQSPSMEPGHEDREYAGVEFTEETIAAPQWSPVMKTGNTHISQHYVQAGDCPQWSPVMKTGNTSSAGPLSYAPPRPSMEPGHEDREYSGPGHPDSTDPRYPQWSPVMKTGNTRGGSSGLR